MAIESDSDRLAMLKACGEQVTFNNGQTSFDAWAIVDRQYVEASGMQGYRPTLLCRDSDLLYPALNVVANGTTVQTAAGGYTVRVLQPDGTGMTTVILEEGD